MEKFISKEKLSKKARRALDTARRGSWYGVNPITRKAPNLKAYNRKKVRNRKEFFSDFEPFSLYV